MFDVIESALSLIITLGILVTVHEYGHFWVARKCGVKVLRFSVGFGKPLYTWKDKQNTEFAIASIPLGGYVKMLDEREGPVPEDQKEFSFNAKPPSQRIAIALAGPLANFMFAIIAYWLMFVSGFNVLIPVIGEVEQGSVAHEAGLVPGVEITSVDGQLTPGWRDVNMTLVNRIGESGSIDIVTRHSAYSDSQAHTLKIHDWLVGEEQTDLVRDLGISPVRPKIEARIGQVLANSPAYKSGLLESDLITQVNGHAVEDWFDFVEQIQSSDGEPLSFSVTRPGSSDQDERQLQFSVVPEAHQTEDNETRWRIGVAVAPFEYPADMIRTVRHGFVDALPVAMNQTWADTVLTLTAIKKMLVGLVSLDNLSGPITIARIANKSISSSMEDFLRFLALLSVSLGVLNLLPIPVLDGGHILYYSIEAVIGKPIPQQWQEFGLRLGLSLILLLMCIAFYNDIMRL